jgi:hypothetical protein
MLAGLGLLATAALVAPGGGGGEVWVVRFEDFVHPAHRTEARRRAAAAGGRWGAIDRAGRPVVRASTREEVFELLQARGYGRPSTDGAWRK